jgi:acetyl esterase/lipase
MKGTARFISVVCMCVAWSALEAQNRVPPPLAPPGETGRRITDDGLLGNYYPASRKAAGLLVLGGSVGGLSLPSNRSAIALQAEGFSVLHLSYFRGPGQSVRLELTPLEYFGRALDWLRHQPEVDSERLAIVGGSRGAEAALLVASRHEELKAVIAAFPSSVVWPGIGEDGTSAGIASAWSESGKPIPPLPHRPYDASKGGTMADSYTVSLRASAEHPEAFIPVEAIRGAVMLVCTEADQIWPSCPMSRQIEARLREYRRPAPILLAYKDVPHGAFGAPAPDGIPRPAAGGGSPEATIAAIADSWPQAVAFLKANTTK